LAAVPIIGKTMSGPAKRVRKPKSGSSSFDDPEQSKRFIEAAREAKADETEAGADKAFKKIVSNKARHGRRDSES
jgi:hypothetical protein